jgi:hypothetical protein
VTTGIRFESAPARLIAAAWWLLCLTASAPRALAETAHSDAQAVRIADQVMQALGGKAHWQALHCVAWTFESAVGDTVRPGSRRHIWDKATGWHRVDGTNRLGQTYVIIHRVGQPKGKAWVNGVAIEGDSLQKLLKRGQSLWTNDTYWMLMPYKLRDPGVHLAYAGEAIDGAVTYDKLALSFENVGETPGDRYWVYVNRANHRVEKWEYVLEGDQPPPKVWTWEGYEAHGGLWFPTAHRAADMTLYTRNVEVMTAPPAQAFATP